LAVVSLLFVVTACGGPSLGTELVKDMPYGKATIFHTEAVDAATAAKVFAAMTDATYNFASNLPEQIDRVNGRLTLRLGNDNQDTIAKVEKNGTAEPVIRYFEGLSQHVGKAVGGEAVDIVLCKKTLAEPFFTVPGKPTK
ncbi:MAG: hypothetical protein JNK15_22220, partial [Planctomycetes bacterium]|nr:hypothetical protein [Planctomycetota bacterium]